MSMHGWAALMAILIGIGGMANYLGAIDDLGPSDMAFPRLNAFAYWINVPAIVLLLTSLFFGWDGGWTVYPPLSLIGSVGFQFVFYADLPVGSLLDSRFAQPDRHHSADAPAGMSLFRMPIFCWASLVQPASSS